MKLLILFLSLVAFAKSQQKYYENPILDVIAPDPCIIKQNGTYYMVYTQHDHIDVLRSPILSNFRNAERRTVYTAPPNRANLWAPEIHFIRAEMYIYFTMDDGVADANHRMYVIKADDPNDPLGNWGSEVRLLPEEEIYAIDGTVMQYGNGELYFIWTGFPEPPGSMNLYIARMEDPMRVIPPRTLLRTPTMDWEMHGYPVNEGPFIIQNAGRTFMVFSGSSTFTPDYCLGMIPGSFTPDYCLGMMGIDDLKDPMIASNWWNDLDHCMFQRNDEESVFGTGHASFVRSPDESELWMVYHAVDDVNDLGVNRLARIQKMNWAPDNAPSFPLAIGVGKPLNAPSGELAC